MVGKRSIIIPKAKKRKLNDDNKTKFLNSIQVPLTNKFDALDEDDDNIAESESPPPQKQTVSPLVVTDHSTNIEKIVTDLNIKVQLKLQSIGRKIICSSTEDKEKLSTALKASKINFYSYPESNNSIFKVVLSGLPVIDTKIIEQSLKTEYDITTIKIIMFKTNSPNKLYLCQFDKSVVDLKLLNTIKSVYHHIIKWVPYKPKQNSPTQCYRCCMYGHGASSCNRFLVCLLCCGKHEAKDCPQSKAETPAYRCFNCVSAKIPHEHKANDPNCPFRAKYELARNAAKNKTKPTKQSHTPNNQQFKNAAPPPPMKVSFASHFRQQSHAQSTHSTASTPKQAASSSTQQHSQTQSQSTPHRQQQPKRQPNQHQQENVNNDLFTFNEIADILFNSIEDLQKCTSKLEQMRVIANMLRHACK